MSRVPPPQRALALRAAALLLGYPDDELPERLRLAEQVAGRLPGAAAGPLRAFAAYAAGVDPVRLREEYVATFDLNRRCCLYLTYYAYGDTRKRGMALLRFAHAYRAEGFEVAGGELPDHLGAVCEFAAAAPEAGLRLLREHRAGLELLAAALAERGSPYAAVVEVVRVVLPDPAPRDLERALVLARTGPPAEEVGLEPFAPPEYMGGRR